LAQGCLFLRLWVLFPVTPLTTTMASMLILCALPLAAALTLPSGLREVPDEVAEGEKSFTMSEVSFDEKANMGYNSQFTYQCGVDGRLQDPRGGQNSITNIVRPQTGNEDQMVEQINADLGISLSVSGGELFYSSNKNAEIAALNQRMSDASCGFTFSEWGGRIRSNCWCNPGYNCGDTSRVNALSDCFNAAFNTGQATPPAFSSNSQFTYQCGVDGRFQDPRGGQNSITGIQRSQTGNEDEMVWQINANLNTALSVSGGELMYSANKNDEIAALNARMAEANCGFTFSEWGGRIRSNCWCNPGYSCGDTSRVNALSDCFNAAFTLQTLTPVNCVVSGWGSWGTCSQTCGSGTQYRSRTATTPATNGGTACPSLSESQSCNTHACPVDCQVSGWGSWGTCSQTCGGGSQDRSRSITTNDQHGGAACPSLSESQSCNTHACPIDCQVGDFEPWGTCSQTCGGGVQERSRSITTVDQHGGASCPSLSESQSCNTHACPVDCAVSGWGGWSECTQTCGGGTQARTRSVTTQLAHGGAACPSLDESQACNTEACPTTTAAPTTSAGCSDKKVKKKCKKAYKKWGDATTKKTIKKGAKKYNKKCTACFDEFSSGAPVSTKNNDAYTR